MSNLGKSIPRKDGCGVVNFSGTSNEQTNRSHYSNLVKLARENSVNLSGSATILGSAAGYGAFYLRGYGFSGEIIGEERDPLSVDISKKTLAYFGYKEVIDTFKQKGLFEAYQVVQNLENNGSPKRHLRGIEFSERDITFSEANPSKKDLIVCDFIHTPEFLGHNGALSLSLRLMDISKEGTLLSYRCGTEQDSLVKIGFQEIVPSIFIRRK
jgi:hypothetical protein